MVSMTTTWTTSREARWGNFTVVMFYNGQGFMVQEDRLAVYAAQEQGLCDAVTDDTLALQPVEQTFAHPAAHKLLPETISKEPLSPIVPQGDERWFDLVKAVRYVLITAEELGVTQDNVESMRSREKPRCAACSAWRAVSGRGRWDWLLMLPST